MDTKLESRETRATPNDLKLTDAPVGRTCAADAAPNLAQSVEAEADGRVRCSALLGDGSNKRDGSTIGTNLRNFFVEAHSLEVLCSQLQPSS